LVIVDTYLSLFNKERQTEDKIIDWSGANNQWKRKVGKGIYKAIEEGNLLQIGKSLEVTERGTKILQDYNSIFEEAKQIYISKAAAALNKPKKSKTARQGA